MNLNIMSRLSRRLFAWRVGAYIIGAMLLPGLVSADEATVVKVRPALWVVEGAQNYERIKRTGKVFLLGSFHLLPKTYRWYDGKISAAFESADELVVEVNMTPEAMAEGQRLLIENGFFTGEENLQNHLDAAHYSRMLEYSEKYLRLNEAVARKLKPWFMSISLSVVAIMSTGMDPNSGVDKILGDRAKKMHLPISELETVKQQMTFLMNHPMNVQTDMLKETLDQFDDFKSVIDAHLKAWSSGDEDLLEKAIIDDMKKNPDMYKALFVNRNRNWIPTIESHIQSGKTVFIVVGVGHLIGEDGVPKMLRDLGYKVNKIQ